MLSVKHLNPRQGITTLHPRTQTIAARHRGVKHLNPRQGITTNGGTELVNTRVVSMCETPKSPPGDYNCV